MLFMQLGVGKKQYYVCKMNAFVLLSVVCSRHRKSIFTVLFLSPLVWGKHVIVVSKHLQKLYILCLKIFGGRERRVIHWKTVSFGIGSVTFWMGNKYICSFFKQYSGFLSIHKSPANCFSDLLDWCVNAEDHFPIVEHIFYYCSHHPASHGKTLHTIYRNKIT